MWAKAIRKDWQGEWGVRQRMQPTANTHLESNVLSLAIAIEPKHEPLRLGCLLFQLPLQVPLVLWHGLQAAAARAWWWRDAGGVREVGK